MYFYCDICDVIVPNYIISIQQHLNGRRHGINLKSAGGDYNGDNVEDIRYKISHYYCDMCDVDIPNNENCIQQHVNGRRHNENLRHTRVGDKINLYYCNICNVNVPNKIKGFVEKIAKYI
ncbi:jg26227 [Pararge aegeria aegeria]|uniref:Jg26227 protein n=1 Tax=Pararge aegeria aegeria TaxID=348720 RepID=A0A8S4RXU0_9NEOP|nr:jg26227 [Pararge aegeria aegeria]